MFEVCPDPDLILDPGISFMLTWAIWDYHATDFFSETYSPIYFKLGMQLPYGEVSAV